MARTKGALGKKTIEALKAEKAAETKTTETIVVNSTEEVVKEKPVVEKSLLDKEKELNPVKKYEDMFKPYVKFYENGEAYLPIEMQLEWFRLSYPNGKTDKGLPQWAQDKEPNAYESYAAIYAHYTDDPNNFLARAAARRSPKDVGITDVSETTDSYTACQVAALSRALRDAGFWISSVSIPEELKPATKEVPVAEEVTKEAPVEKAPVAEEVTKEAPVEEAPVAEEVTEEAPVKEVPVAEEVTKEAPVKEAPVAEEVTEEAPATEEAPVAEEVTEEAPATEEAPVAEEVTEEAPATEEAPVAEEVTKEAPVEEAPVAEEVTEEETEKVLTEEELKEVEEIRNTEFNYLYFNGTIGDLEKKVEDNDEDGKNLFFWLLNGRMAKTKKPKEAAAVKRLCELIHEDWLKQSESM